MALMNRAYFKPATAADATWATIAQCLQKSSGEATPRGEKWERTDWNKLDLLGRVHQRAASWWVPSSVAPQRTVS